MALKIGPYIATGKVSGESLGRQVGPGDVTPYSAGKDIAQAVGGVAGVLAETEADKIEEKVKADNAAFVMDRVTTFENETRGQQNTMLESQGKNAANLDATAASFADEATERALNGVEDPMVRTAIISQLSTRRRAFLNTINGHARKERMNAIRSTQIARLSGLQQDFVTTTTPEDEQAVLRDIMITSQSMGAAQGRTQEEIDIDVAGQVSKVTGSKVATLAASDPQQAMAYYREHEDSILPLDRAGLLDRIQGKIDQQQRRVETARKEKRAELVGNIDDAYTYMLETGDAGNMQNISTSLRAIGFDDDAEDVELQVRAGSMAYDLVNQDSTESFSTRIQNVQNAFPVHGVKNAADLVKARDMATQAIAKQAKQFMADPAGYVDQGIPGPVTGDARLKARLERQRELGEGLNYTPTVMTVTEKKALANKWNQAESARDRMDILMGADEMYGDFAPAIYQEAGFPVGAMAGADLIKTNFASEADAQLLVTAATLKPSEIPTRPDLDKATVQSAVQDSEVFGVYTQLASMAGADVTLQQTVRGLQGALSNAVLLTGDTDKGALLDNYYGVINDDEYVLTYDKQRIDDGKLEDVLDQRKEAARGLVVGEVAPDNIVSRLFGNSYDNSTTWINAPDGNGWVLFNKGSQTVVADTTGEIVRVTEDDVFSNTPGFGKRADNTEKGLGFFGVLNRPDGGISTELSIGVEFDGKETEIPLLVPTLTSSEINLLLAGDEPTDAVVHKAITHAKKRIEKNKSPFAQKGEQQPRPE